MAKAGQLHERVTGPVSYYNIIGQRFSCCILIESSAPLFL